MSDKQEQQQELPAVPSEARPQPSDLAMRLRNRIRSLVNRGADICGEFQAFGGDVSCRKCGYTADVHLLRDVLEAAGVRPPLDSRLEAWATELRRDASAEQGRMSALHMYELADWLESVAAASASRLGADPRENVLSSPMAAGLLLALKAECETQHSRYAGLVAALRSHIAEFQHIVKGFKNDAMNGVICTPPYVATGEDDWMPNWDATPERTWCARCRGRWQRLFDLPARLAALVADPPQETL